MLFNTLRNSIFWYLCLKSSKKADIIVVLSEFSKRKLLELLGYDYPENKIVVVPEGVDAEKFNKIDDEKALLAFKKKLGIAEKAKIILNVGSEQPRKNFRRVLFALYKANKELGIELKLIKIGKPQVEYERKKNLEIIEKLGLQKNIVFIDSVSDSDLVLFYNIADCLLLPTLSEGGFALPILEAFACGTPVITSDIPPIIELTGGKGAIFVNPYSIDSIVKALRDVLKGYVDVEEITREAFRIAMKYNWERSAELFYDVYKSLSKF
jgi:glycosyltransferase involved in cell wall biosynthesis